MNRDDDYQVPWRPNYEGHAIVIWLIGIGVIFAQWAKGDLPIAPHLELIGTAIVAILYRMPAALRILRQKQRLRHLSVEYIEPETIAHHQFRHPNDLWLGRGFEWTQKHAQLSYELLKRDASKIVPYYHGRMGATWIHGLESAEDEIFQPLQHSAGHTLIVGTTGAGKTRTFDLLITQAVMRNEAVIIIDPKGDRDLMLAAQRACEATGQPERFVFFHPAFPSRSVRLNPLKHFGQASELASRIAQIIPSVNGSDPFKAFGQKALDNIIQGMVSIDSRPTLVALRRYLEGGPGTLVTLALRRHFIRHLGSEILEKLVSPKKKGTDNEATTLIRYYRDRVQKDFPNQNLEGLISMYEHDRTHFGKMVASLLPIMNMLTTGDLGSLLSPDITNPEDTRPIAHSAGIIDKGQVAYIGLDSLSDGMVGSAIGSILLADIAAVAGKRYNYGVNNRPVNVFVDEAAEVINDPCIQLLNKGRGALIRMVIATQTFADFSAKTGSEAKARQILANVNTLISLRVLDSETQKYITENLPETRLRYVMRTQGISTHSDNPAMFSGNIGERLMEEQGALFPPPLLGQLPDLHYIAKLSGGRTIKGRIPILSTLNQTRNVI